MTGAYLLVPHGGGEETAHACPPGYLTKEQQERAERRERRAQGESAQAEHEAKGKEGACYTRKHPEPKGELMTRDTQAGARVTAPATRLKPGAYAAAARTAQRLGARASSLPGAAGNWQPAGKGPLVDDNQDYPEVNGQGLADLNGRIADFATRRAATCSPPSARAASGSPTTPAPTGARSATRCPPRRSARSPTARRAAGR